MNLGTYTRKCDRCKENRSRKGGLIVRRNYWICATCRKAEAA